jgi:Flp pilus assembly protein TadD
MQVFVYTIHMFFWIRPHMPLLVAYTLSLLFVGVVGYAFGTPVARFAWEHFHVTSVAKVLNTSDAELAMTIGAYYLNGGAYELEQADHFFNQALLIDPEIPQAHYQLGRVYFVQGDLLRSLMELEKEKENHPEFTRVNYMLGLTYGTFGDTASAVEYFSEFVRTHPSEWAGYNDLAWVLMKGKQWREARATIAQAFQNVEQAQTNPWLWNNKGVAELNMGLYQDAYDSFTHAQELGASLTPELWRRAYPGNDPALAEDALQKFHEAVATNLQAAQAEL